MKMGIVFASMCFAICGCSTEPNREGAEDQSIVISNQVTDGVTQTIILATNATYFTMEEDRVGLTLMTNGYSVTVFLDSLSRSPRSILQEITITGTKYWITDMNADGVADMRRAFGAEKRQILFNGEWIAVTKNSNNWDAELQGVRKSFQFVEGRWKEI